MSRNPYEPPGDAPTDAEASIVAQQDATRARRFSGAMIDGLLALLVFVPVQIAMGLYDAFPRMEQPTPLQKWALGAFGFLFFVALHGRFIHQSGQTIGKKLVRTQIVDATSGEVAGFQRIVLYRFLPMSIASLVPVIGPFLSTIDALFIFRHDRRCIHDHIARTRVISIR